MGKVNAVLPNWKALLIAVALTTPFKGWSAVESTSANFVSTATVIQGNGGAGNRVNYFALPAVTPVAGAGKITATGPASLSDANANWGPGQFNGTNGAYYVELDSGLRIDIAGTDNVTKTLTFASSPSVSLSVGAPYRIRRHLTVADVFGPNNEAGLLAGPNGAQAENIVLQAPQSQQMISVFYLNVTGYSGWYLESYAPAGQTVIRPEAGLIVRTKTDRNLVLYSNGAVKDTPTVSAIYPGFNLVGTVKAQRALKLSELNLVTGTSDVSFAGGSNPAVGDNLILMNPDSSTATFFYLDRVGFEGWYNVSYQSAGNVTIPAGAAFFIQRKAPRGAFYWSIPGE